MGCYPCASPANGHYAQAFAARFRPTKITDAMRAEAFEQGGQLVGFFTVRAFLVTAVLAVFR
jgi:hypothetical protein